MKNKLHKFTFGGFLTHCAHFLKEEVLFCLTSTTEREELIPDVVVSKFSSFNNLDFFLQNIIEIMTK